MPDLAEAYDSFEDANAAAAAAHPSATADSSSLAFIPPPPAVEESAPASQPSVAELTESDPATTQPSATADAATTQPSAAFDAPATQPAASNDDPSTFDRGSEPQVQPGWHFALGQTSEMEGHADCAVTHYEQALRLSPRHVPSLYRMGVVLTKQKKYDEAAAMWDRYIVATGNHASGYSNLGFTWEMAGNVDKAEAAYKKGLEIDPQNEACRVKYGLMLARNNRTDEAQEQLAAVLPPAEVSYNLATIFEQQGAMERAKEELQKALAANPDMKEAQNKLATLPQD